MPRSAYLGAIAAPDGRAARPRRRLRAIARRVARWPLAWVALLAAAAGERPRDRARPDACCVRVAPPRRLPRLDFPSGVPDDGPDDGRRADAADERRAGGRAARAPRGAGARQPRSAHPLRDPQRLRRRGRRASCRGDAAILDAATRGHRGAQRRRSDGRGDRFFLFHRERRWNPRRGRLDGLGAQARQDRGVQPAAAGRDGHELLGAGRRRCASSRGALLHHARLRHAPAARRREAADRHHRPPAEPAALRRAPRPGHARATASCSRASA